MVVMMQMVHNWDHPGQWDTFQRISKIFVINEKRKYRMTELPFKEIINEQLSIPDSTATDDIQM